jgi:hypothetical protein
LSHCRKDQMARVKRRSGGRSFDPVLPFCFSDII